MSSIEILALVLAVLSGIKLLVFLISPKSWLNNVTKRALVNPTLTTLVSLALAVVTLILLLKELTIVQIFAAMLFTMCLFMMGLAPYSKDMLALGNKIVEDKDIFKKVWLVGVVWLALVVWVLYSLFF